MFSLFLCANDFAAQDLPSAAHKDMSLGIVFPKTLGGLELCEVNEYQEPGFGYSLRYERADLMKADIYIYDKGIPDIPTGCNNKVVKSEADTVRKIFEIILSRHNQISKVEKTTNSCVSLATLT